MSPRSRLALRRVAGAALLLAGLLAAAVAGLLLWVRASLPPIDGIESVAELRDDVLIERDASGRVTVRAGARHDLWFGIGYAHAQDRFFQMDLMRRAGQGTLAALVGPAAVAYDEVARRHDLAGTARGALAMASAADREVLEAYAEGVNAGLASLGARPWEYLLLRTRPQPWHPIDALHVALAMFRDLQDATNAHERALDVASRALDPEVFAWLRSGASPWEAPLRGEPGAWPRVVVPANGPGLIGEDAGDPAERVGEGDVVPQDTAAERGSNAWAVGGGYTADGRALLASDMHLRLGLPPIWTAMRLVCTGPDSLDVAGVLLPGTPVVVAGSNGHVAWGFTNSYGDWLDHVVLERDSVDPSRYRTPDGWRTISLRRERIAVAGGDGRDFLVEQTVWGPVVGEDTEGRLLALRWVAQDPQAVNLRLLDVLDARTVQEVVDLGPTCGVPHQNLVVADAAGNVGWTIAGRVPRRAGLDGPRPRAWADAGVGWSGWLEPDEVPRVIAGPDGRIWSANARMVSDEQQRVLGDGGYALGARARRIRDVLRASDRHDESSMSALQLDTRAELMEQWQRELRRVVERAGDTVPRQELLALLDAWTGHADAGSASYRFVREWRREVHRIVIEAFDAPMRALAGASLAGELPRWEVAVWALLQERPAWAPAPHANWDEVEAAALATVLVRWGDPSTWTRRTWGEANELVLAHPLSSALPGFLRGWIDLGPRRMSGDSYVPRVSNGRHSASERLVVAPGAEERGLLQLPGGPTAHPMSPYRRGDFDAWVRGEPVALRPGPAAHVRRLRASASG